MTGSHCTVKTTKILLALLASSLVFAASQVKAREIAADPLGSPIWSDLANHFLPSGDIVFDPAVKVIAPAEAEDSLRVPVHVDATALADVEEIIVFADLNPIPKILDFEPLNVPAKLGFQFKVQQSTPIRAAARTADGNWHVGYSDLEAAGGGCTLPSMGSGDDADAWVKRLGEVAGKRFGGGQQIFPDTFKFSVVHPMDTGLAPGIAAFYIDDLKLTNSSGQLLARLSPREPVSENPLFSLDMPPSDSYEVSGRDNNGNRFRATFDTPQE